MIRRWISGGGGTEDDEKQKIRGVIRMVKPALQYNKRGH